MKILNIDKFKGGWICGDFDPNIIQTKEFEVGFKYYNKGESAEPHVHKEAIEISVFLSGKCKMNDQTVSKGDIVVLEKGEPMLNFECLEDAQTVVIKTPSVKNDKYMIDFQQI